MILNLCHRFSLVPVFGQSTVRGFPSNTSELKKLAAHDFEDIILCSIPCFEGLLPDPDNTLVLNLLYTMCRFHSLAKLRMHTEETVARLRKVIATLGNDLRLFESQVCANYETFETPSEMQARGRANLRRAALKARASNDGSNSTATQDVSASGGSRLKKPFNLNTYKLHAIADYPDSIIAFGPLDVGSTKDVSHDVSNINMESSI